MKIAKYLLSVSIFLLSAVQAHAFLPNTAYTSLPITIYGVYTTIDPTCQSGFVATIPVTNASQIDLTQTPSLGNGGVSSPIGCAVILMKNSMGPFAWAAGSYTGTTSGFSDSACNAGGNTGSPSTICNGGSVVSWPSEIQSAVSAAGLTPATTALCAGSGTANIVVPIYVSTDSACTGNPTKDTGSCIVSGNDTTNAFQPPTAANDILHGLNMTSPATGAATYRFFIDPSYSFGATGASSCGGNQPSIFGFKAI
jgi:hypothetical protein